jgi:hypothetical protein
MPGTVKQRTSPRYLQKTNVVFVREEVCDFLIISIDKSHFITEVVVMKTEQIESIRRYVSEDFFDVEKLIKYLDMHSVVGNEVFAYVDKKACVKKNRIEGYCDCLDDENGYVPITVDKFIRRIPFYFYVWDGSIETHSGDLGYIIHASFDRLWTKEMTLEQIYESLEYLFYEQKLSLYDIFNYMIEQTGVVTQYYFYDWVDYLHICENLEGKEKMPECFITAYNQVLEEIGKEPIRYEINDFGTGDMYMRDGKIMIFEGVFPIDEARRPIMKWAGLKIVNGGEIWNYSCEKSKSGRIGVELTPNIIIYYWTECAGGEYGWIQLYAGPQNMEFDHTVLKKKRKFHKMTQQEVANAVGANVRTYQKWESGEAQPDGYYLLRLINWLDIHNIQYVIKYNHSE